jgi:hypothetical protein
LKSKLWLRCSAGRSGGEEGEGKEREKRKEKKRREED